MEKQKQYVHEALTLKRADQFSKDKYKDALKAFKELKCGHIIKCDALYDIVDQNAVHKADYLKGTYKLCYFVVVEGPIYDNNGECTRGAIVLKINSKKQSNYQLVLEKGFVPELTHDKSYVSCKSILLGPEHFKTLEILKHVQDPNKDARLSIVDTVRLSKSLQNYAAEKKNSATRLQNELIKAEKNQSETEEDLSETLHINSETEEDISETVSANDEADEDLSETVCINNETEKDKMKKERQIYNYCKVAAIAEKNAKLLHNYASNPNKTTWQMRQNYRFKKYSNKRKRERSREKEERHDKHNDCYRNKDKRGGDAYRRKKYLPRQSNNYDGRYNHNNINNYKKRNNYYY